MNSITPPNWFSLHGKLPLLAIILMFGVISCKKENLLELESQSVLTANYKSESETFLEFIPIDDDQANSLVENFIEYTKFSEGDQLTTERKEDIQLSHWLLESAVNYRRPNWADYTIDTIISYQFIIASNDEDSIALSDLVDALEAFEDWLADEEESLEKILKFLDVEHPTFDGQNFVINASAAFGINNSSASTTWPTGWLDFCVAVDIIENRINVIDNLNSGAWLGNVNLVHNGLIIPSTADITYGCTDCLYTEWGSNLFNPAEYQNAYQGVLDLSNILINIHDAQIYPASYGYNVQMVEIDCGVIPSGNPAHLTTHYIDYFKCYGARKIHQ